MGFYIGPQKWWASKNYRSLRFNSADSSYLSRTPASAGNRKTWTWAGWVKRSGLSRDYDEIFGNAGGSSSSSTIFFNSGNSLFFQALSANNAYALVTTQVFRDPSAWYHIVVVADTTNAVSTDRLRIYVNGSRISSFSTANYPPQNYDTFINQIGVAHYLGRMFTNTYFNGYLADINFIDGQALDPTSFGFFDSNGVWQPKTFYGDYGTNGFRLNFGDNTSTSTLGLDVSGKGNHWTANNLSVTAGAGNDSFVDSPFSYGEDTGVGGEVWGNYCTLNPLDISERYVAGSSSIQNGNLTINCPINSTWVAHATFKVPSSGKWYFEATCDSPSPISNGAYVGALNIFYANNGNRYKGGWGAYGASYGAGDIIGVAVNADSLQITFYKNGVSQGVLAGDAAKTFIHIGGEQCIFTANFGQRPFAYAAPSGFKALCTTNLPAPTIADGSTAMDVVTYTGNGSTQTISGLGFNPDLIWIKARSSAQTHSLTDSVRGTNAQLFTNLTNAEGTQSDQVTAFNSDGFSLGANVAGTGGVNSSSVTYCAWTWDAGSSTVTNTDGSITSQVRANPSAGFSIVTYTGNLTASGNATVGHGLGVAPQLVITKARSTTSRWAVQMPTVLSANNYLELNTTIAQSSWGSQTRANPTSTVFDTIYAVGVNENGVTFVAYCFAPVEGYSAFGSYTGNGSTDGPFVYTGFRPKWLLIKRTDSTSSWFLFDAARVTYNVVNYPLHPDIAKSETDTAGGAYDPPGYKVDFLSNGFKIRNLYQPMNNSAGTFLWAAFAEHPFRSARAR